MSKKRIPVRTIFIACEGKNTEPIYFERIKEEVEDVYNVAITIYPDRSEASHKSDPIGLVCEAKKNLFKYDEVWAVYDKDGYTKHEEALEIANEEIQGKRVNVAFSSISFEQWVLLHFEKSKVPFAKSQDIIDQKFEQNEAYFPKYDKSSTTDVYPNIKDKMNQAMENSAWLRHQLSDDLKNHPVHQINPYTDIDRLICSIFEIDEIIMYISLRELVEFDEWQLIVEEEDTDQIKVIFQHDFDRSIVTNEIIFRTVEGGRVVDLDIPNQQVLPREPVEIIIKKVAPLEITYKKMRLILEFNSD